MSMVRLNERVPSAQRLGLYTLKAHTLRFHKASRDGSGKCDAFHTGNPEDRVIGALFEICPNEKKVLDQAEDLGHGYHEKTVEIESASGIKLSATTYYAAIIEASLKPYSWYKNHVLIGAIESSLPETYIQSIRSIECIEDSDKQRAAMQFAIHC